MSAAKLNLAIEQNATFRKRLTYLSSPGNPIDLTGCSAKMQIRSASGAPLIFGITSTAASTNGSTIALGGVAGTIDLFIDELDLLTLAFGNALYDLLLVMSNGDEIRLVEGAVCLSAGITVP